MITNTGRRLSKSGTSVIFECKDSRLREIFGKEVNWPERFRARICPSFSCISIQTMNNDNALVRGELWKLKTTIVYNRLWHLLHIKRVGLFVISSRRHDKQAHGKAGCCIAAHLKKTNEDRVRVKSKPHMVICSDNIHSYPPIPMRYNVVDIVSIYSRLFSLGRRTITTWNVIPMWPRDFDFRLR